MVRNENGNSGIVISALGTVVCLIELICGLTDTQPRNLKIWIIGLGICVLLLAIFINAKIRENK